MRAQSTPKAKQWTDDELMSVMIGVELHGDGKWAQIESEFKHVFEKNSRDRKDIRAAWRRIQNTPDVMARLVARHARSKTGGSASADLGSTPSFHDEQFHDEFHDEQQVNTSDDDDPSCKIAVPGDPAFDRWAEEATAQRLSRDADCGAGCGAVYPVAAAVAPARQIGRNPTGFWTDEKVNYLLDQIETHLHEPRNGLWVKLADKLKVPGTSNCKPNVIVKDKWRNLTKLQPGHKYDLTRNHPTRNHPTRNHPTRNHPTRNHPTRNQLTCNQLTCNHPTRNQLQVKGACGCHSAKMGQRAEAGLRRILVADAFEQILASSPERAGRQQARITARSQPSSSRSPSKRHGQAPEA